MLFPGRIELKEEKRVYKSKHLKYICKMKRVFFAVALCHFFYNVAGQDSTQKKALSFSGYAEIYYLYDFNKPVSGNRPDFIYSHNRHNEFILNLGYIKAGYSVEQVRANLALAAGTYMNANYTSEPGVLKNVLEANAGIKISKKKNIWIDAGILPSHIGFESAISKDCQTLTRSLLAENSPYFEAGAKLTYTTDNGKWIISAVALNGWQRITRKSGNSQMSWGTQVQFKPSDKILLNYSSFAGSDSPDSTRKTRLFNNLYGQFAFSDKAGLTLGFDIGFEETSRRSNSFNTWYAPIVIMHYTINKKWTIAARAEYYSDKQEVIIGTGTPNGFQTSGYSLNIDYTPARNVLVRVEGKALKSKDAIFTKENSSTRNNSIVIASVAVAL